MKKYLVKSLQQEKHGVGQIVDAYTKDGVPKVKIRFPESEYFKFKSDKTTIIEASFISENNIISADSDVATDIIAKEVTEYAKCHYWVEPRKEYANHCWKCKVHISSASSEKCPYCGWYICSECGACKQDCTR